MTAHLRNTLAAMALVAASALLLAADPAAAASSSYSYSSQYQYFTVPAGITSLHIAVAGGSGADGQGNYGGGSGASGGEIDGDLTVTPGQVLTLWVGGAGQPGGGQGYGNPSHNDFEGGTGGSGYGITTGNGGGGGAASYVKLANGKMIAVGGGGGGGGGSGTAPCCGSGGSGGYGSGGASSGSLRTNGYDGSALTAGYGATGDGYPGTADAANSDNGVGGGGGGYGGNFGGGGGGGGGGYFTCDQNEPNPANNHCYSAGGGGGGGGVNSGGGAGGAGGNTFGDTSLHSVSFKSSGFSASTAGQITINYASSSNTSLSASPSTINEGDSVRLNAFVQPTDSGGTVAFSTGGQTIPGCGSVPFTTGGGDSWIASCTTSSLPAGTDGVMATFSGDSAYGGSSGTTTVIVYGTPSVTTSTLPHGTVGQSYSQTLQATGGSGNYSWSLKSGSLPDGLTLSSSSGTISGTPTRHQSTSFTVQMSDTTSGQTATRDLGLTVDGGSTAPLIIEGFRFAGPGGASDQYVELYNPTSSAVSLTGWQLAWPTGSIGLASDSVPAHGHYLVAGSGYSLAPYTSADATPSGLAIPAGDGVQLIAPDATPTDAVGMTGAPAAYRAGTGLATPSQNGAQLAYQRRMSAGAPVTDTTNNAADFVLVATDADTIDHGAGAVFGAPGPQNATYRIEANDIAQSTLVNPRQSATGPDNRTYDAATGTLTVRRTITNASSTRTIKALWLRYTSITTYGSAGTGQAILTVQSSSGGETVNGKTMSAAVLDQPPTQPNGGGLGSSVYVNVGGGLAPGQSINVDLQFHVVRSGSFSFGYNAEVITGP